MNKIYLEFEVHGQEIKRTDSHRLYSKSKNLVKAKYYFDKIWDDIDKYAQYTVGDTTYTLDIVDGVSNVPWEVLQGACVFSVSVFAGDLITANIVQIPVGESGLRDGQLPSEPTPGYFETVIATAQEAANTATEKANSIQAPFIGENNNWFVNGEDTGERAVPIDGEKGDKGEDGKGVTILGSYDTYEELTAAHPTGNIGDLYLVDGNLYVWSQNDNQWANVGNIQGPAGKDGKDGADGPEGTKGDTGAPGKDGISATHSWNGTTLTVTSASGTSSANLKGDTGDKGDKGDPGTDATVTIINNLTSTSSTSALSAAQGKVLYDLIGDVEALLAAI